MAIDENRLRSLINKAESCFVSALCAIKLRFNQIQSPFNIKSQLEETQPG